MSFAFLVWSLLLLGVWGVVHLSLRDSVARHEMLVVSGWTSLLGLSEPIFVPAYWNPPTLFDLAQRTGFDIESLLFAFAVGGLAVTIYEWLFRPVHAMMPPSHRTGSRHRLHVLALISAPIVFAVLRLATRMNPIYATVLALLAAGLFTWYCRPDLITKMLGSAVIFTGLYFVYFWTLVLVYPGYVRLVWNLPKLSGILVAGVPLEELLFAVTLGFYWSSLYEHAGWYELRRRVTERGGA